jgi:dolichyl-phosphate-mannose--protein O-mannosyl transferase
MSQEFHEKNVLKKFVELNVEMYKSNQRLTSAHPYSSRWYSWPFMARPIFYWVDGDARIYFLGNPVVWWASTVGVVLSIWYLVLSIKNRRKDKILILLLGAYALNLLPFMGIQRVMFLYHYMTAMVFAVLMLTYVVEKVYDDRRAKIILTGLVLVSFASFLYFAPLTYGLNLSPTEYEKRVLLPGWK